MLKHLYFSISSICLTSFLCTTLAIERANASFACGPHLQTYRVHSIDGIPGRGVRCLKFLPPDASYGERNRFIWYGEGTWENVKYRHVGHFLGLLNNSHEIGERVSFGSSAADIFGNGEETSVSVPNETFYSISDRRGQSSIPFRITITAPWREQWTLEQDGIVEDYTSSLGPVRTCGPNFREYSVSSRNSNLTGQGVRCMMTNAPVWYGEGNWNGNTYAHLGYFQRSIFPTDATASDICESSRFNACGNFPEGSLHVIQTVTPRGGYSIRRSWNEIWRRL